MARAALVACLLAIAPAARAEGLRVGNWPTLQAIAPAPAAAAAMTTSVAVSTSSILVAPANAARKGLMLYNNSTTTVYIAYDATATTTHLTFPIATLTTWTMPAPIYTGPIAAVRAATGDGKILATELQ